MDSMKRVNPLDIQSSDLFFSMKWLAFLPIITKLPANKFWKHLLFDGHRLQKDTALNQSLLFYRFVNSIRFANMFSRLNIFICICWKIVELNLKMIEIRLHVSAMCYRKTINSKLLFLPHYRTFCPIDVQCSFVITFSNSILYTI